MTRRSGIQRIHIGQQNQGISTDDVGDQRRKAVIVTESDLVAGKSIIFVDYGDDPQIKQAAEGPPGIAVLNGQGGIAGRNQNLTDLQSPSGKGGLVPGHEESLAYRGGGLLGGHIIGPRTETQGPEPGCDGSRGHQDQPGPIIGGRGQGPDQCIQA